MRYWFYLKTYSMTQTYEDGTKEVRYLLAFVMLEMKPLSKVILSGEMTPEREACNRAFALACRYSRGRDLVEEIMASNYGPLGKRNLEFTIEMVNIPVYSPVEGVPFSRFDRELQEGEDKKAFTAMVEEGARILLERSLTRNILHGGLLEA
jgi:hypothetical protein